MGCTTGWTLASSCNLTDSVGITDLLSNLSASGDGDNHLSYDEFKCNVVNLFTGKDASKAEPNPPPSTGGLMGGGLGGLGGLLSG